MANADAPQVMSLPLPPVQYVNLYTDDNVKENKVPRPPQPIQDTYSMFGNTFNNEDMIRSLESQGFRRLIPIHFDRRRELKKLNHSLFVNFLDLIDILIRQPDSPKRAEKIEDLTLLFVHIHHLLNEFRPHQARETLRVMMELQKRQRCETIHRFQKHLERVRDIIKAAFNSLPDQVDLDKSIIISPELNCMDGDSKTNQSNYDLCYAPDRLMCTIIDNM